MSKHCKSNCERRHFAIGQLKTLRLELDTLTPGNVSHRVKSLETGLDYVIKVLEETEHDLEFIPYSEETKEELHKMDLEAIKALNDNRTFGMQQYDDGDIG